MREELFGPKVENVGVAVVQELLENNEKAYNVIALCYSGWQMCSGVI